MKKHDLKTFLIGVAFLFTGTSYSFSQVAIVAAGGGEPGTGGSVEFSIGQVSYLTNAGSGGTISEGVQQPYEIFVITSLPEAFEIELSCSVFPNPTSGNLVLKIDDVGNKSFSYHLFDLSGKRLQSDKISINETIIEMESLPAGIYILKVIESQKEQMTFKIIKN